MICITLVNRSLPPVVILFPLESLAWTMIDTVLNLSATITPIKAK